MARIKKDSTSWKAEGLKERYRNWEEGARPLSKPKKKDKKKWCKGKVGREHDYQTYNKYYGTRAIWQIKKCARCHKESWKNPAYFRL